MTENQPLAHWIYSKEEWNEFVDIEKKNKREDNFYFGLGILILVPFGLMLLRSTSFLTGILFAVPFAFLIPWLRMKFAYKHLRKNVQQPYVTIYSSKVDVNGKIIELANSRRRIKAAKIVNTTDQMQLIEIDVQWMTGKGPTNDEFRFPIPQGEENTAKRLVAMVHS